MILNTETIQKYKSSSFSYLCKNFVFRNLMRRSHSSQAMLISILMVTAAALAIGLAVAAIGSSELVQTVAYRQSAQAYAAAESCLEDELMRFTRVDYAQPANPTVPFTNNDESCTIVVTGNLPTLTITSTGHSGRTWRILEVVANINNASIADNEKVVIQSWKEIYN